MARLSLELDPRRMETGADRGERALDGVKRKATQTESAVERLGGSFDRAGVRAGRMSTAMRGLSRTTRGGAGGIQNVAFQVGDFATQVGAGTAASVALGQQLPQLLGGFGALGAVLGAVVAIGVPLAASFLKTAETADTLKDAIDDVKDATKSASDELLRLRTGMQTIEEAKVQNEINNLIAQREALQRRVETSARNAKGAYVEQLETVNEQISAHQAVLDELQSIRDETEAIKQNAQEFWATITSIDISPLINQASTLAAQFSLAAQNAAAMVAAAAARIQRGREVGRGRGTFAGPTAEEINRNNPAAQLATQEAAIREANRKALESVRTRGGGGGGSAVDKAAQEVERVKSAYESLISTLDPLIGASLEYRDAQVAINAAQKAGVISAEEATRALDLAKERMQELKRGSGEADDAFKGFFGDALTDIKNVDDALGRLANRLASLAANSAIDSLFGSLFKGGISSIFGGLFGSPTPSAKGNIFSGGNVVPFAKGGVVGGPTVFPMKNGTGLMGEAGPEAIMPLKRGPGGRLGVESAGGGGVVRLVIEESPIFASKVRAEAQGVAVETMTAGFKQHDRKVLPGRIKAFNSDPRRR